jgi:polyphosphate:AMP phosphotransferase
MLKDIDLSRKLARSAYKEAKDRLDLELTRLERRARELGIPVLIVFEGWNGAGKGDLINKLILPMDPRGFTVHAMREPIEEERMRPFLWRFWRRLPPRGRVAIFDRSWYRRVLDDRVEGRAGPLEVEQAYDDIASFERLLATSGTLFLKFFLHISKKEQAARFERLAADPTTAWRVTDTDRAHHEQYDETVRAVDTMLARSDTDYAPWVVVEAHDRRFATIKILTTVVAALQRQIAFKEQQAERERLDLPVPSLPDSISTSMLDKVDLSQSLERRAYGKRLHKAQKRLAQLHHEIYTRRIPVVLVYEGWDAAGKGGNIRRLTQSLDPRGYEVIPIAAPNDLEKAHHYLWRFWTNFPKAGHIAIFDRSWYGRVMVERIEGFCSQSEWRRAYREINEMERNFTNFGTVLLKFWIHIDQDEQLARFEARQENPHKQWKITDEDWRNREKWDDYRMAVDELLLRTSTPKAPWHIIESNCKLFARVKAIETVVAALEARLAQVS